MIIGELKCYNISCALTTLSYLTLLRRRTTIAFYRFIQRFAQIYRLTIATMYFKRAIVCSYDHLQGNVCRIAAAANLALSSFMLYHRKANFKRKKKRLESLKFGSSYRIS